MCVVQYDYLNVFMDFMLIFLIFFQFFFQVSKFGYYLERRFVSFFLLQTIVLREHLFYVLLFVILFTFFIYILYSCNLTFNSFLY